MYYYLKQICCSIKNLNINILDQKIIINVFCIFLTVTVTAFGKNVSFFIEKILNLTGLIKTDLQSI